MNCHPFVTRAGAMRYPAAIAACALLLVAGAPGGAQAQSAPSPANPPSATSAPSAPNAPANANSATAGGLSIPLSRVTSPANASEALPARRRFVSEHSIKVGGQRISYTAIAGETYLYNRAAEPIGSIFSFSYIRSGTADATRPVVFVFNGGPGSSSLWLHMGAIGPRRVVLDHEVNPSNVPPFGIADNPYSLLDVADLVFVDPVGTGYSRVIGKGATADFWGVDEDADSVAQFMELWLSEHGRWNSPKFLVGESYGSVRAAILPRVLMGGPLYVGIMRGITVNGVVLLGTVLTRPGQAPVDAEMRQALALPAIADTAWYHSKVDRAGRSLEDFHQQVLAFARGDYVAALRAAKTGSLTPAQRSAVVAKLASYTGLPATSFANSLVVPEGAFSRQLLADRGLQLGMYDGRYTLPLAGSGDDPVADDPAMGRYVPGFVAAFHQMLSQELRVQMQRPYGAIVWKDLLPAWNWQRALPDGGNDYARDLAIAMRRNSSLRVMVASGYFDLVTHSAQAEWSAQQAGWPDERVTLRHYASGHMLYLGDTAEAFANDVRELIRSATQ